MSEANSQDGLTKQRRVSGSRAPAKATPAFFVLQVLDDSGKPTAFDKKNVRIVGVERSAEKVLEAVESGEHEHAFYLRGMVPAAREPKRPPGVEV